MGWQDVTTICLKVGDTPEIMEMQITHHDLTRRGLKCQCKIPSKGLLRVSLSFSQDYRRAFSFLLLFGLLHQPTNLMPYFHAPTRLVSLLTVHTPPS